jgi:hypothetical protein
LSKEKEIRYEKDSSAPFVGAFATRVSVLAFGLSQYVALDGGYEFLLYLARFCTVAGALFR